LEKVDDNVDINGAWENILLERISRFQQKRVDVIKGYSNINHDFAKNFKIVR
jgi:hypothetical protein